MKPGATEELIVALAADAQPVRLLPPPEVRFARWVAASAAMIVAGVLTIGLRPNAAALVFDTGFVAQALLLAAVALVAAAGAFVLSVPGRERTAAQRWAPLAVGTAWAVLLVTGFVRTGGSLVDLRREPLHAFCAAVIMGFAVAPGFLLFAMVQRAAPLRRSWSAGLVALGGAACGLSVIQWVCPIGRVEHLLVAHALPAVVLAMAAAVAGAIALERIARSRRAI
jgi:hypothetical protein